MHACFSLFAFPFDVCVFGFLVSADLNENTRLLNDTHKKRILLFPLTFYFQLNCKCWTFILLQHCSEFVGSLQALPFIRGLKNPLLTTYVCAYGNVWTHVRVCYSLKFKYCAVLFAGWRDTVTPESVRGFGPSPRCYSKPFGIWASLPVRLCSCEWRERGEKVQVKQCA